MRQTRGIQSYEASEICSCVPRPTWARPYATSCAAVVIAMCRCRGFLGTPTFMAAYQQALGGDQPHKVGSKAVKPGTMRAAGTLYFNTTKFRALGKLTKRIARNTFERFCERSGNTGNQIRRHAVRGTSQTTHRKIDGGPGGQTGVGERLAQGA